jgi:NAD(P)-dependent dehydrogenase (short-subunit alcohol dehydrogenase family)
MHRLARVTPRAAFSTGCVGHAAENKASLVVGAGDALGGAIARRFALEGYEACVVRRNGDKLAGLVESIQQAGGRATPFGVDARVEEAVVALVSSIEQKAPIEVCVHNIGANVRFNVADTTARVYTKTWEMVALSAFLVGREVSKRMVERGRGTLIFTGATASLRGGVGYCAFAGAMHAKRALAQSLARELGPLGVHVAHVVVDGAIDTPWVRATFPEMAAKASAVDGLLLPDAIAENYWHLHVQPRTAWTHELDLRPYRETW